MKNIKKILALLTAIGGLLLGNIAYAQVSGVGGQTLWKLLGGSLQPVVSSWTIGSSANRVAKIWATDIDSTSLSIGGVSGNLDMGGFSLTNALGVTTTALTISGLADPAGTFVAIDPDGNVIATTTPTGGGSNPWAESYDAGTFDLFNVGKIGIGTSTPLSYLDIRATGAEDDPLSAGISLSTTEGDEFFIFTGGGTFEVLSREQYDAGIGTGIFYIGKSASGEINLGTDAAFTGSIAIGNGELTQLSLDANSVLLNGDNLININSAIYFTPAGFVGIGTSTPYSPLHIETSGGGGDEQGISFSISGDDKPQYMIWQDSSEQLNLKMSNTSGGNQLNILDNNDVKLAEFFISGEPLFSIYGTTSSRGFSIENGYGLKFADNTIQKTASRWKDGASVVNATTTDEAYKIGNCLEPGVSVTLDSVVSIIASTTNTIPQSGMTWNINYGANFYEVTGTLFSSDITTTSTSTQEVDVPDVTALPAGSCWWFKPVSAQTAQIGAFNFNLYGYED